MTAAGLAPFVDLRAQPRVRVIPDVHGASDALRAALRGAVVDGTAGAGSRFVLLLGDLVDRGADSAGALTLGLDLVDAGRGALLLGNHEWKLLRALAGRPVQLSTVHRESLAQIEARPGLTARFVAWGQTAPVYALAEGWVFAHAAFDPAMTGEAVEARKTAERLRARALFGAPTGRTGPDGHPERSLDWVDELPPGVRMVVGHDCRSDTTILRVASKSADAAAYLLDLGAGMGGPLAWIDLDLDTGDVAFSHPVADYAGEMRWAVAD